MTTQTDIVLAALRANVEYSDDGVFGVVYLDNARPDDVSVHSFRSCLAALAKRGDYKVIDGDAWGAVRLG